MFNEEIWEIKQAEEELVDNLVTELDLAVITAKILVNRGYSDPVEVEKFLDCNLNKMYDPYLFNGMETVVTRIRQAIEEREKIVIYGDYDVDGITSSSLLLNYLRDCGAEVDYYIPNRLEEGYGLNETAIEKIAELGAELIITVDCGIKAHQEIELANSLGMEVIVTDHHTVPPKLPAALEVINPKRADSTYPFAELAGVGVAFKIVQALELARNEAEMPAAVNYLALVTLGVVADIVPLRDENRIIVKEGLKQLNQLSKEEPSLFALAEVTGCLDSEISVGHIAFGLAPRINACGRLGEPNLGVELFLSSDYGPALELAQKMDELNDHRQQLSQQMQEEAEARIEQLDLAEEWVIVLASANWHSGVIGNVASDINEKYNRPVILMAIEEEGIAKGSARSISNFNIHDALLASEDLLIAFGGHEQAAGLSISEEQIPTLKERLNQYAKENLAKEDLTPRRKVDAAVKLEDLSFSLVNELNDLAPFGCANPGPKLVAEGVEISDYKLVGSNKDHLKLTAKNGRNKIDGIAFSQKDIKSQLDVQSRDISLLFNLEINSWRGRKNLQLKVKDIKVPIKSAIDQLFAQGLETLERKDSNEEYFTKLVRNQDEELKTKLENLKQGQEVRLVPEVDGSDFSSIKVAHQLEGEIGYLPSDLAQSLARKLELGVQYQANISKLDYDLDNNVTIKLFIKKDNDQSYYKKLAQANEYQSELITQNPSQALKMIRERLFGVATDDIIEDTIDSLVQENNTLTILNPAQNKDSLLLSFAAWKRIQTKKTSILIYPYKSILEQRYPIIKDKLSFLGLQVCQASTGLTDSEEEELKRKIEQKRCDLLVATPQFLTTDIVNLAKIKVGFIALDGYSEFIDASCCQPLAEVVSNLDNPLILALDSAVSEEECNQLLTEFNFDNQLISNYNKSSLGIVDKRNLSNKDIYLKEVVNKGKQTVIYVNSKQKTIQLTTDLRNQNPKLAEKIIFYHQNLSKEQQRLVQDEFRAEEVKIIVATAAFNELLGMKNIEQVVFYNPCFNSYNFKYLANQAVESKSGELYLLYQEEELNQNQNVLAKLIPNRKLLKELYLLLYKNKNKAGEIIISQQEILYKLNSLLAFSIPKKVLVNSLNIFEELNLVQRDKEKGGMIKLLAKPKQKLDLFTSIRYNECVVLKDAYTYLKNLAAKEEDEISNSITETYLTILKGENDIEFSR